MKMTALVRYSVGIIVCLSFQFNYCTAQKADKKNTEVSISDSTVVKRPHSPFKATIMSVALPGLGQVYNGKWWKVPIIYGAFGGLVYSAVWNHGKCRTYRDAYLLRVDDDPATIDQFQGRYTDANLRQLVDYYQRNRDISFIFIGVFYALNIIDAGVDAHLKGFDVSDDLSMQIRPTMQPIGPYQQPMPALAVTLRLK